MERIDRFLLALLMLLLPVFVGSYADAEDLICGGYICDIEQDSIFYTIRDDGLYVSAQSVELPYGITFWEDTIKAKTFYRDTIYVPGRVAVSDTVYTVVGVDKYAFYKCAGLKAVFLPETVSNLGETCFYGCTSLRSVSLTGQPALLPQLMFYGCSSLETFQAPSSVTEIGYDAFRGCSGLRSFVIPDKVQKVDSYAFRECSNLEDLKIGGSVKSIGREAFAHCTSLTSMILPDSAINLGENFIFGCTGLKELVIPENLKGLYYGTLQLSDSNEYGYSTERADQLCYFEYRNHLCMEGNKRTYYRKGFDVMRYMPIEVQDNTNKSFESTFASDFDTIPNYFWQDNSLDGMVSLTIPASVEYVGDFAFSGCNSLSTIRFEGGANIGKHVFSDCDSIEMIILDSPTPPELYTSLFTKSKVEAEDCIASTSALSGLANLNHIFDMDGTSENRASYFWRENILNWYIDYEMECALPGWYDVSVAVVPNALIPNAADDKPAALYVHVIYIDHNGTEQRYSRKDPEVSRRDFRYVIDGNSVDTINVGRLYFDYDRKDGTGLTVMVRVASAVTSSTKHLYSIGAGIDCIMTDLISVSDPSGISDPYKGLRPIESEQSLYDSIMTAYNASVFTDRVYSEAELLVPQETLESYRSSGLWGLFSHIAEYDPTGIIRISSEVAAGQTAEPIHYGTDGRVIAADAPGLHIVRMADGTVRKFLVPNR